MDQERELGEKLREASCIGDEETIRSLISKGVDVNAQNNINGWTALHWAAKRGHRTTVTLLMSNGANPNVPNNNGEKPGDVASDNDIRGNLGIKTSCEVPTNTEVPGFVPNYLAHPQFPYVQDQEVSSLKPASNGHARPMQMNVSSPEELVLKARVANSAERDFIEVEMDFRRLTYENLMSVLCSELQVNRTLVQKIRKLPDTIVRKDKDVRRLQDFQEVELVLCNKAVSESSRNYSTSVAPRHVDVVY